MQEGRRGLLNVIIIKVNDTWLDSGIPDGQAAQTTIPNNAAFQTEDLDAYDSGCDDVSNAKAVLMANLSNYGSDVISEDFKQTPLVVFLDNEITSDSNIIPYSQYLQETQQAAVQDTNLYAQQDSILQQELSAEQAFWLQTSHPNTDQYDISPVKIEAPRELPKEVMLTVMSSTAVVRDSMNLEMQSSESCDKCSNLDAELLKKQNAYNEILKIYSQLEKHCISLELTMQLNQESFQKDKSSSKIPDSNIPVLPSTELKSSTSASRSQPTGNKKNDKISQTPRSNMKNKVEVQLRRSSLSSNKKNRVKDPMCDAKFKHTILNAKSKLIYVKCKQCMFDANHDVCFLDFVNDVNVRSKSKFAKQSQHHNIWKPTGKVFTKAGYKWKPTGKLFTLVGNSCPLTRFTSANLVPPKETTYHSVETQKTEIKVYSRRPKQVKYVDIPSSSSLVNDMLSRLFFGTIRFRNNQIAKIIGYGDYQLGNVTISRKPDLSFLPVFDSLCYLTNDSEDLGKLNAKADIGFVPNPVLQQPFIPPTKNDWVRLFKPMFDEYFNPPPSVVSPVQVAATPRAVDIADSPVLTLIDQDAPSTSIPSTQEQEQSLIISQGVEESPKLPHFHNDPLHETLHEDSTSQGSSSNVRPSYTPLELLGKWTKNHPIANVIGDPSRSVSTRKQLQTDAMWCYFDAFLTSVELNTYKEAMLEPSWIDAMQEEIHEFERLQVWELVLWFYAFAFKS
ncbi:hypothetical protein Tco_0400624 [Tanacetum coccineum]